MEEVRFYYDRAKFLGFSILPATLLASGIFLVLNPQTMPQKEASHTALIGCTSILIGLCSGLWTSFGLFSKKAAIILSPEGITDGTVWSSRGFVPWSMVVSCERKENDLVVISLVQDTSPYPAKMWKALLRKASEPEQIRVPVGMINVSAKDFETQVCAFMTAAHAAQPPQSQESLS